MAVHFQDPDDCFDLSFLSFVLHGGHTPFEREGRGLLWHRNHEGVSELPYFFSRKSLKIVTFWEKSWGMVEKCVFSRHCFFFGPRRTRQWVGSKLFVEKKIHTHFCWKKNTRKKWKSTRFSGWAVFQPGEWLSDFS